MNAGMDLDRRLEVWFAEEAPAHAPDRVLATAMERVDGARQRGGLGIRVERRWAGLTRRQRILLVLASLLVAVGAVVAVGALATRLLGGAEQPSLLLVRSEDGSDQPAAILVVERAADGSEQTLARFTSEQLGGTAQLWMAPPVISAFGHLSVPIARPDGTYGYAVADLRDASAPVQQPDLAGSAAVFGPDGDLGISTQEGIGVHDPFTGTSTSSGLVPVDGNPPYPPTALDQVLSWATDGSGVLADAGMFLGQEDGTIKASAIGILHRDGAFVPGTVPLEYAGVRARRTDPNGVLLRCAGGYDSCFDDVGWSIYAVTNDEMHEVWKNPTTDRRISDFAWAVDGGLWLLLESAAPGPRAVSLVRVDPAGAETTLAEFEAPADDPDEGSYFQSSTFAGMAPDDSSLVVRISGDQGAPGEIWLIDTATGEREPITGSVAGWHVPGADPERPPASPVTPTDPALRDLWADAATAVRFGATSVVLDAIGSPVPGQVEGQGAEIAISGAMEPYGCTADQVGRYGWAIEADALTLTAIDEPCPQRAAALARTFLRSFPTSQDGPPRVAGGSTKRAAAFIRPFVATIPSTGATPDETELWAHRASIVGLNQADPTGTATTGVTILAPTAGANDPCEHFGSSTPLQPGAAGILAYLEAHELPLLDQGTQDVDGHVATTFRLEAPADCFTDNHSGLTLFGGASESPTSVGDGARFFLFELEDGTPILIIDRADQTQPEAVAWVEALIDSIHFDTP